MNEPNLRTEDLPLLGITADNITAIEIRYADGSTEHADDIRHGFVLFARPKRKPNDTHRPRRSRCRRHNRRHPKPVPSWRFLLLRGGHKVRGERGDYVMRGGAEGPSLPSSCETLPTR